MRSSHRGAMNESELFQIFIVDGGVGLVTFGQFVGNALVAVDAGFALLHPFLHITLRDQTLRMKVHGLVGMAIPAFMRIIRCTSSENVCVYCISCPISFQPESWGKTVSTCTLITLATNAILRMLSEMTLTDVKRVNIL